MSTEYLHREDAPFSHGIWEQIDRAAIHAAKNQLCARRMLDIEGPYGLGLKFLPGPDRVVQPSGADGVELAVSEAVPLLQIRHSFALPARDIATFEQSGQPIDLCAVSAAAVTCAKLEDELVFYGSQDLGIRGLLTSEEIQHHKFTDWTKAGAAANDVIEAVTLLDKAGFHGPYALGLAPALHNQLYRHYPGTRGTELEHLKQIIGGAIVKAPGIQAGGILLATGAHYATIALGQDFQAGFTGPAGAFYEFFLCETIALRLRQPKSVCALIF